MHLYQFPLLTMCIHMFTKPTHVGNSVTLFKENVILITKFGCFKRL